MTTITAVRHIRKFYFSLIFFTLFFVGLGLFMLRLYATQKAAGNTEAKVALIPLFVLGLFGFAVYTIVKYIKNAPPIKLDQEKISFNGQTYSWTEVENIALTGKQHFAYLISFPMEATTIKFTNGQTRYIFDDMYSNSAQIKSFLQMTVINKGDASEVETMSIDKGDVQNDYYDTFKGNQFISLRGICLWGFLGFFAYLFLIKGKTLSGGSLVFFSLYFALWFVGNSWFMHYFQVGYNFLVVKNHNFLWMSKAYHLSEIQEVVFETRSKWPYCLRIITKDFKNKLYPAGTLNDRTWIELKEKLEGYGIKVRNECVSSSY